MSYIVTNTIFSMLLNCNRVDFCEIPLIIQAVHSEIAHVIYAVIYSWKPCYNQ